MNKFIPVRFSRFFAAFFLLAFVGVLSQQADAASTDPRMFGPWAVEQAVAKENIGLRVYFSPDGNFFMVDPKTQLGVAGNWMVGRAGILVSIYGDGKWAKLWDADIAFEGNDKMIVDVKESQVAPLQQFTLLRLKN